jgi:putative AdoMet-dependent methyltransferase
MTRTDEQTRKLFDEWAKSYDADLANANGPLLGYARSLQAVDVAIPVVKDMKVLDIGIGTGAVANLFAKRGAQVTGVDISQEMLDLCNQQYPDFDLHLGTFTDIPLNDDTFDYVVSGFAFHETSPDKRANACREIARVLKPQGYLFILDIMFASNAAIEEASELIANEWDENEDYAIVGDLDRLIREQDFASVQWRQTAPFHWMIIARKI